MGAREDSEKLLGLNLWGTDNQKIGRISAIYVNAATGEPEWVAVRLSGLFGGRLAFAPVAHVTAEGEQAVVGFDRGHVRDAPRPATEGAISPAEEERLAAYYGMTWDPANPSGSQDMAFWASR